MKDKEDFLQSKRKELKEEKNIQAGQIYSHSSIRRQVLFELL
jgi:hypothetical protein